MPVLEGAQVFLKLDAGGVAIVGVERQRAVHDCDEIIRHVGVERLDVGQRAGLQRAQLLFGRPFVKPAPSQHLVEHDAERVEVGAAVESLAARLFGRHVGELAAAQRLGELGAIGVFLLAADVGCGGGSEARDAEVYELDLAFE